MEPYQRAKHSAADVGPTKTRSLATAAAALLVVATIAVVTALVFMRGYAALDAGDVMGKGEAPLQQAVVKDVDPFLPDRASEFKAPPAPEQIPKAPGQTLVSLTFDDGFSSQGDAVRIMREYGFRGTFFINSGSIGKPGYLTLENLRTMAEQGHEIGGHSVSHPNLPTLPPAEVKREICLDRAALSGLGFNIRNFAYPYAAVNDEVRQAAMECGYNTARGLGGVRTRFSCPECPWAETVPPASINFTAAPDHVTNEWTLEDLKDTVRAAQPVGGWVQLTFHRFCTSECNSISVTESLFAEFLSWLRSQTEATPTVVRSVEQVIGGSTQPLVAAPAGSGPAAAGANRVPNPDLDEPGQVSADLPANVSASDAVPRCWRPDSFGNHQAVFKTVSPGRSGDVAMSLQVKDYRDGEAKLVPAMDLGQCAPEVTPGRAYFLEAWYKSTAPTQFSISYRLERGVWVYWTSSTHFPAAHDYAEARWMTPPVPPGATAISFGLGLLQDGQLTTDDYALTELQGRQSE